MYIHIHTSIHIYMYECVYIYKHISINVYIYIYIYVYKYIHIYVHIHTFIYIYMYIYTYMCIYVYICICSNSSILFPTAISQHHCLGIVLVLGFRFRDYFRMVPVRGCSEFDDSRSCKNSSTCGLVLQMC